MVFTELGMVTEVRLEHPVKAHVSMEVTEFGMVTEGRLEQFRNILNIDNQ